MLLGSKSTGGARSVYHMSPICGFTAFDTATQCKERPLFLLKCEIFFLCSQQKSSRVVSDRLVSMNLRCFLSRLFAADRMSMHAEDAMSDESDDNVISTIPKPGSGQHVRRHARYKILRDSE